MKSERIKEHKKSGYGVPVAHTCKDGDFESTANCPACKWLRERMEEKRRQ